MYTGILYATIGLLVVFSLLLYLLVRIMSARGSARFKQRMQGDIERLDDLPPPIVPANAAPPSDLEVEKSSDRPQEADDPFLPSTLSTN